MKNITSKNKYPIKKLDTRINKFTSAFKIESIVLTIFGQNKFSIEYQDRGKLDPDFHNFYLPNFDKFLKYFSKHHKKIRKRESISSRKQKTPKQVFGRTIKYQIHMKILWNELLKNKKLKSFENFWRQVHYSAKLIGKQPVGYLDPMINFSKYDSQSKINIQNYLELGLTCVVFVRFNEPILGIEIAVCIESNTKQIHRIPESEFSFDEMRFLKITKSLADLSINYKLAMNFKNNYPDEKFDLDKFTFLIQRCMELTNLTKSIMNYNN